MGSFARSLAGLAALSALTGCEPTSQVDVTNTLEGVLPATESSRDFGDYVVYFNALNTEQLTPEIARQYEIVRSKSRALLNVSIHRKQENGAELRGHRRRVRFGHQFEWPTQTDDLTRDPGRRGHLLYW